MIREDDVYRIGRLGKTHGVRGELSFLFDDDVFDRADADYLVLQVDGILVPFFIEEYRFKSDSTAILKLEDVDTQERARQLTGTDVYFPKALVPQDDEGQLSLAFLVGFDIVDDASASAWDALPASTTAPPTPSSNWTTDVSSLPPTTL